MTSGWPTRRMRSAGDAASASFVDGEKLGAVPRLNQTRDVNHGVRAFRQTSKGGLIFKRSTHHFKGNIGKFR